MKPGRAWCSTIRARTRRSRNVRTPWTGLDIVQPEPNLTAILPGECQARCRFCHERKGPAPASLSAWMRSFEELIGELPSHLFRVLSLSGGEPTLSPVFAELLELLRGRHGRFTRVVLTTNGGALTRHLHQLPGAVSNVNLSRHAVDDADNEGVFRLDPLFTSPGVPSRNTLGELIRALGSAGVLVNLNCVYSAKHFMGRRVEGVEVAALRARAEDYIRMARDLGAHSISFRYDHHTQHEDAPTFLEDLFADQANYRVTSCSSCRVVTKLLGGLPVNFKRSAFEPVSLHPPSELYELVFHSNGVLARDWQRRHVMPRPVPEIRVTDNGVLASQMVPARPVADAECAQGTGCRPVARVGELRGEV